MVQYTMMLLKNTIVKDMKSLIKLYLTQRKGTDMKWVCIWLVVTCAVFVLVAVACENERPPCEFVDAQFVRSKLSGDTGQIVGRRWGDPSRGYNCSYDVRFMGRQETTDTHLFNSDGAISVTPLTRINRMRAYELEALDTDG